MGIDDSKLTHNGDKQSTLQKLALPLVILLVIIAVAVFAWLLPKFEPGQEKGVGADGFYAKELKNKDLGVGDVLKKSDIESVLGGYATKVEDSNTSTVMDLNGSFGQTATFNFTTNKNVKAKVTVDFWDYKDRDTFESADTLKGTVPAGEIDGKKAYYLPPTLAVGGEKGTAIIVNDGKKSYKFAILQPEDKITIQEAKSLDMTLKIAQKAVFIKD